LALAGSHAAAAAAAAAAATSAATSSCGATIGGQSSTAACSSPSSSHSSGALAPVLVQRRAELRQSKLQGQETALRPLTVLCWNVLYTNFGKGKGFARYQLANIMTARMRADVAGLQECMNEDEMQQALGWRMTKAPGTDIFNCIFYKPSVVEFGGISGRMYLGNQGRDSYSERFVSYAKLLRAGREFWVFSTHWCLDNECGGAAGGLRHKHSAQVILAKREELGAADMPTIITADANSHMDGYDEDDGVQWLLTHGFEIAGKGPMMGGIDYIFVSKGHWSIGAQRVGPTAPSDHPSFTVELTLAIENGAENGALGTLDEEGLVGNSSSALAAQGEEEE